MNSFIRVPSVEDRVKIFDAIVAASNNLLHSSLKDNIFYLHIHKCGGTSIAQAIKSCYRDLNIINSHHVFHLNAEAEANAAQITLDQGNISSNTTNDDYLKWKLKEYLLLYYMSQKNIKYVAGHFSFSATAYQHFSNKYAFITVLRDPIKRYISAYFYVRYKKRKIDMEISEFLKSELGLIGGSLYVKHLGGVDEMGNYTSEIAINRAKENLHKFSVVGCLEYQEDFLNQFEKRFGRRLKIREFNQSTMVETDVKTIVTEEIKEKIREICKPDIEIYQYAIHNFVNKKC